MTLAHTKVISIVPSVKVVQTSSMSAPTSTYVKGQRLM